MPALGLSRPELIMPAWDVATLIGLGVPLYLVTMASQNLPGFAVLRASGYQPPTQPVLAVTGAASLATAFLGAHTSNLAAISAALCTGPEAHPDPGRALEGRRLLCPVVGPDRAVRRLAGRPVRRAAAGACWPPSPAPPCWARWPAPWAPPSSADQDRFAAAGTLAVTASGVTLMGVGSAFWGLAFGLIVLGIDRYVRR